MNLTIGADPEIFIRDAVSKRPACPHGMIPGTKAEPYPVKDGAIQIDGMALEFNIDPCQTEDEFLFKIQSVMGQLRSRIDSKYEFKISPSQSFTSIWDSVPEESKELGCDPDYNAYTGEINYIDPSTSISAIRGAGGHVHVGWRTDNIDPMDPVHFEECRIVAKELDIWLGLPSLHLEPQVQAKERRRQGVGLAGAFRPKPYGLEYRTLSNFWLKNPKYIRAVYRGVHSALSTVSDPSKSLMNRHYVCVDSIINRCSRTHLVPRRIYAAFF